ncbi:hypothetical protein BD626DRAFT_638517 [Schizophyllum amplum]|uniref:Uncharacterized protein n=1 Tax=Schizophyllum amplum TaxID=97359 RepID=A0A550BRP2_9AGAR|nr:hypothetical protein BD626DRAFT_638517 [Auriculariopsis ampla]
MGHGEVQALGGAIYEIQILEIEDAADARAKPHLNEIRRLLQKRPFDVLLDETPDMNLADFMARKRGDDMMYSMRVFAALRQISLLKGMQNERIWDPDPAIWPHLYRWAEYMSPVYHNIDIDALSPKVRDEIFGLVPGLVRVLQCVTSLPRSEGIAILSDVGYLPLRIAADLWAGWPRIFGSSPTTARAQESVRSLVTMFPLLCTFLDCETPETQGALRSELERLTNGRAHGFLRTIGRNVEMVIDFDDESGRTVYTQMNFARQLVTLRMSIEHVPRATISSAVSALRRFAKSPTSRAAMSIRYSAAGMLLALCPIDPSSLVPAIRLGLFQAFAQIRANCTKDDSAMYKPVLQLIWFAMVQRKAVKALYKSRMDPELEIPPSDIMNLYEVDQMLLATSAQRYRLLKEADADWEKVNTCCNAKERNCAANTHVLLPLW